MEIKVVLEGEMAEKFLAIKKEYGLRNNSETIRFCVNKEYKQLFSNKEEEPERTE